MTVALFPVMQILLVGDSGVGKSSLLMRFSTGEFDELQPTIGAKVEISVERLLAMDFAEEF